MIDECKWMIYKIKEKGSYKNNFQKENFQR